VHAPALELSALGRSGIEVSRVALGANNFGRRLDLADTRRVVDAALEAGMNFIDTADAYGAGPASIPKRGPSNLGDSERFLGEVLAGRRDRVVLATKVGNPLGDGAVARGSEAYLRRAVDASLARLRVETVDVLYYHRWDGVTPLEETVGVFGELVVEGKARAVGCSGLSLTQLETVGPRISVLQNHLNLLERSDEAEVLPLCVELGVGYVPFFPLAGGLLTGKYRRGVPAPPGARLAGRVVVEADLLRVERLERFARERGRSLLELAIAGLASMPGVCSVIAGATSPEQVRANAAAGAWRLTAEELDELRALGT
jgi:aryl-alcohol dehydrogenase-like predicted oxidoreductase